MLGFQSLYAKKSSHRVFQKEYLRSKTPKSLSSESNKVTKSDIYPHLDMCVYVSYTDFHKNKIGGQVSSSKFKFKIS